MSPAISPGRDAAGELARLFAADPNLTPAQRIIVETEEAWTLGVVAPKPVRERAALASGASLC